MIVLPYDGPLDWPLLLGYFARRAIAGVEAVDLAAGTYRRTIVLEDGEPGVLELRSGGDGRLLLDVAGRDGDLEPSTVAKARRIFALDDDPTEAAAHLTTDAVLAPLVAARPGLRVPGTWDPYETGVRAIVGQQVSVAGASTVTARIVARAGTPLAPGTQGSRRERVPRRGLAGVRPSRQAKAGAKRRPEPHLAALTHVFPAPDVLAGADLAGIGMPGSRVAAIQAFAAAVADGRVPLDRSVGLDDLMAAVCAIRGLGPWTASYLALRLGEPDAFPAADLGLRRAAGAGVTLSTQELAARAEAWRPWRSQAALRLWLSEAG